MKLSREWLNEYTVIGASDKEYADKMTMSGSKVEGTEKTGEGISRVVVGRIKKIERHENADRLLVCTVDAGPSGELVIVTGAPNVSEGDLVPVALDGSTLPGGTEIKAGELRGVMSAGMLCSLKELALDLHDFPYADGDGIFILKEPCEPGQDIIEALGLGDSVIEFEITSNRPDCLSVIGLARESAAVFGTELDLREPNSVAGSDDISSYLRIEVERPELCPRYTARMVRDIKIEPSPRWMRRRLRASGVRPINNIVDITNYVMLEYGQPMHAFDYSCVGGGVIKIRTAHAGEQLETLDGTLRGLNESMLVIADGQKAIGVAGVMGGGNSEITDKTSTIVFESACFNGTSVRKTSIALGMRTDASSRFEKGLDPANTMPAVQRACELIERLGAGRVIAGCIDVGSPMRETPALTLEPARINALLGTDIDEGFMTDILKKLGFGVDGGRVSVPGWRADIEGCADLAEEVARFYGYDKIEPALTRGDTCLGGYTKKQSFERELLSLCRGLGFYEIVTYSFGSAAAFDKIRLPADSPLRRAFVIQNPLGEDSSVMRTTPLPSMLDALSLNLSRRNLELRLCELATVYAPVSGSELADETRVLTLGLCGAGEDFFALKGCVEAILRAARIRDVRFAAQSENAAYHPGRCAEVYSGDTLLGVLGQIHPVVAASFGAEGELFAAELYSEALLCARAGDPIYEPLPRYPAITRDLAVVADLCVTAAVLEDCIKASAGEYLESVRLFDVYTGAPIPQGKRSLAFSLTLRARDQTLTDELADKSVAAAREALESRHGAVIR